MSGGGLVEGRGHCEWGVVEEQEVDIRRGGAKNMEKSSWWGGVEEREDIPE